MHKTKPPHALIWVAITALLLWCVLLWPVIVNANSLVLDPTKADQDTLTIQCKYPVERTDGTPLAIGEIAAVNFFVRNGNGPTEKAGSNSSSCKQVYDLTNTLDGVYTYTASVTDTGGRTSIMSATWVELTVKRLPNPRPPSEMFGSGS